MSKQDLFVVIYTCCWATLITLFVFICWGTKCLTIDEAVLISNAAFLGVTSVMVFVKPVREFVNKLIQKLP